MEIRIRKKYLILIPVVLGLFALFWFSLPRPLFDKPLSTVLYDRDGMLIAAHIANDGQWRFPEPDSIPEKFIKSIIYYEDQYFYYHPGVNPVSILKALVQNLKAGEIVRGGSTITLQVIRMSRGSKKRTVLAKFLECFMALRLELSCSKQQILKLYTANAPFGSNVVGLEAASWRYFGRSSHRLSWGETATLAVLPNAPSLIYPGKNHDILLVKRNRLLDKLYENDVIDSLTCQLAKLEPLPGKPVPLPQITYHLLSRAIKDGYEGKILNTTIDEGIQQYCNRIIAAHHKQLSENEIQNAALIVLEVETGNVLAYVGNVGNLSAHTGSYVDIINAERSSGSILKPFLYAALLKEGQILPNTLIPDIPTQIAGYSPMNFDKRYDGAVKAGNALARSLNIPAVRMLQQYGVEKFHHKLQELNFSTINRSADNYGLSLILGGAEVKLWELAGVYANMARMLLHYSGNSSQYTPHDYHEASYVKQEIFENTSELRNYDIMGAASVWHTFEALTEMNRPIEGTNWDRYVSSKKIAWKTGTSYGHRDAWAIGITPGYVVGVWVGNADGEGRPGLTGASTAAPVLFDVFNYLPPSGWFSCPYDDMIRMPVCDKSGYKASSICDDVDTLWVTKSALSSEVCPYHQYIHLDKSQTNRVNSACYPVSDMVTKVWFVLPTVIEWYYKSKDPYYKTLPPFMQGCSAGQAENMALIYPETSTAIFIPRGFDGTVEKVVFEAAHKRPDASIFWHLDEEYMGTTSRIHQLEIFSSEGYHVLTLVDDAGERISYRFEIVDR